MPTHHLPVCGRYVIRPAPEPPFRKVSHDRAEVLRPAHEECDPLPEAIFAGDLTSEQAGELIDRTGGTRAHPLVCSAVMQRYIRRSIDLLEPIARMGMGNGELWPGDARRSAIAIGAMIEGTLLLAGLDPGGLDRDDLLRRNVALVFDGLAA
jgi:hypothetical protein